MFHRGGTPRLLHEPHRNFPGYTPPFLHYCCCMEWIWWLCCLLLMLLGIAGCVLPLIPGTSIIFLAALAHRLVTGSENGLSWGSLLILLALLVISYVIDFVASAAGAKYFGAGKWGIIGGIIGAIVGIFFGLPGILLGPLIGVVVGELLHGKRLIAAGKSSVGTFIGTAAASVGKIAIAITMTAWFVVVTLP